MTISHTQIDQELRPYYLQLEERGIPIDASLLRSDLIFQGERLLHLREEASRDTGFIPNFMSVNDWLRVYQDKKRSLDIGPDVKSRIDFLKKLFLEDQDTIPVFKTFYEGRNLQRDINLIEGVERRVQRSTGTVHPVYRIHPNLGRVYTSDPNIMGWTRDVRNYVRKPGHFIVEASYNLLELRVLQQLSRDSTLEIDLRDDSSAYIVLARRLFNTYDISEVQELIAKASLHALTGSQSGEAIYNSVNSVLIKSKMINNFITQKEAHALLKRWQEIYSEAHDYLKISQDLFHKKILRSYYGRVPDYEKFSHQFSSYNVLATAADIANQGFLNVFRDGRITYLKTIPITTAFYGIVLEVPEETDFDLVSQYLEEDMLSVDPAFTLKVQISQGDSWFACH